MGSARRGGRMSTRPSKREAAIYAVRHTQLALFTVLSRRKHVPNVHDKEPVDTVDSY
jgi:hypothetical protein